MTGWKKIASNVLMALLVTFLWGMGTVVLMALADTFEISTMQRLGWLYALTMTACLFAVLMGREIGRHER
jgi:hypothetical protein